MLRRKDDNVAASEMVRGQRVLSPRLTRAGYALLLRYVALPLLAVLLVLDVLLYVLFRAAFDWCYGLLCLL